MATIDWPSTLRPQTFSPGFRKAGLQHRSPFNGTTQAIDFIAERWVFSITLAPMRMDNALSGVAEALVATLAGGVERVRCFHFARPVPRGTMRGTPTLSGTASRGATTLALTGAGNATTLKTGDLIGAGGQIFMVAADITFSAGGTGTVSVVNRVRATINTGAAVTWSQPTAEFIMPAVFGAAAYRPAILEGLPFELEEIW